MFEPSFRLLSAKLRNDPGAQDGTGAWFVTTGGEAKFEEIPVTEVPLKSRAIVIVHLRWSPPTVSAGSHSVSWLWYSGEQLVHASKRTLEFKSSPYRLWAYQSASGLGLGHYRVLQMIEDQTIDTEQFEVVP